MHSSHKRADEVPNRLRSTRPTFETGRARPQRMADAGSLLASPSGAFVLVHGLDIHEGTLNSIRVMIGPLSLHLNRKLLWIRSWPTGWTRSDRHVAKDPGHSGCPVRHPSNAQQSAVSNVVVARSVGTPGRAALGHPESWAGPDGTPARGI